MPMSKVGRIGVTRAFRPSPNRDRRPGDSQARGSLPRERALVPFEPAPAADTAGMHAEDAGFMAQLCATQSGAPQTRRWRRAAPIEAAHSYDEMRGRLALSREPAGTSWRA